MIGCQLPTPARAVLHAHDGCHELTSSNHLQTSQRPMPLSDNANLRIDAVIARAVDGWAGVARPTSASGHCKHHHSDKHTANYERSLATRTAQAKLVGRVERLSSVDEQRWFASLKQPNF